jgi:hypothetical protein
MKKDFHGLGRVDPLPVIPANHIYRSGNQGKQEANQHPD